MRSIILAAPHRGLLLAVVLVQAFTIPAIGSSGTAAQDIAVDLPEAVAIEDITHLGCVIETIEYANGGFGTGAEEVIFTDPINQYTEPCPPGTVLHKFPTTVAEAEALGLPYVTLTGDEATDRAAIQGLQATLLPAAPEAVAAENAKRALPARACTTTYKEKGVSYWAGATGAGVTAKANYLRETNCTWYLVQSRDYLFDNLSPGQDLYWDQVYYPNSCCYSWDAGCQPFEWGDTDYLWYGRAWWINVGDLYTDETINDTSFGCDWWGEEYTGSVYLT